MKIKVAKKDVKKFKKIIADFSLWMKENDSVDKFFEYRK